MAQRQAVELGEVGCHGAGVPAGDRTRETRLALAQCPVEGGGEQRAQRRTGLVHTHGGQDTHGLCDDGEQVVGAVGQGGVVARTGIVVEHEGFPAELDGQCLGDRQDGCRGGHGHGAADQAGQVHGGAGEGHGRVDGERDGAGVAGRVEDAGAVAARGVCHELAVLPAAQVRQAGDEGGQGVVGYRQENQLAALHDLLDTQEGHPGEEDLGPVP